MRVNKSWLPSTPNIQRLTTKRPALKPRSPLNTLVGVFGYAHTCNSETGGCEKKASLQFRKDMLPYLKSAAMPCAFQTDLTDSLYMNQATHHVNHDNQ